MDNRTSTYSDETFLGWTTLQEEYQVTKDIFSKYNIAKRGGFDIKIKMWIKSIQYKYDVPSMFIHHDPSCEKRCLGNGYNYNYNQEMLSVLKKMQMQLDIISTKINFSDCGCNIDKINSDGKCDQLKKWILNIFDNNKKIGEEYIKIIIDDQGFDDIDIKKDILKNLCTK